MSLTSFLKRIQTRDNAFHELLTKQAEKAYEAATEFQNLSRDFSRVDYYRQHIAEIEHEADQLLHQLANRIDSTFVTPMDKEDLRSLSNGLDDITDHIESTVARIGIYHIRQSRPELDHVTGLLVECTGYTRDAVAGMSVVNHRADMHDTIVRIHDVEERGDQAYRKVLEDMLFTDPQTAGDYLSFFRWKEVFDRVELSLDACEDVANMIESVLIKYA